MDALSCPWHGISTCLLHATGPPSKLLVLLGGVRGAQLAHLLVEQLTLLLGCLGDEERMLTPHHFLLELLLHQVELVIHIRELLDSQLTLPEECLLAFLHTGWGFLVESMVEMTSH